MTKAPTIAILIGLQASGKTTFARRHIAHFRNISRDSFRNNRKPDRRQAQLVVEALKCGSSVVVDNTNPTVEDRRKVIDLARMYKAHVVGYYFPPDVPGCIDRNELREGKEKVPVVGIYATAKNLQLPTYHEGFDELYAVTVEVDGSFTARLM